MNHLQIEQCGEQRDGNADLLEGGHAAGGQDVQGQGADDVQGARETRR